MGHRLARDALLGADRGDRVVRYPDRAGTGALQHDSFGIAGQHGLGAVAEVADRDAVQPAGRQRAADVEALGRGDQRRADGIRQRRQRANQLRLPLRAAQPAAHHLPDQERDQTASTAAMTSDVTSVPVFMRTPPKRTNGRESAS